MKDILKIVRISAAALLLLLFPFCHKDLPVNIEQSEYPNEVGNIIITKCANKGCHDNNSKYAAGGLSLETWTEMMKGGSNGATVIPFNSSFSTLCYYINDYSELGLTLDPRMPYGKAALSKEEVVTIFDWINKGAKSRKGEVFLPDFSDEPRFYVINQGTDHVTVFDEDKMLAARYVRVGNKSSIESPHMIKISPDNHFYYVVFINGNVIQKYRTADNSFVSECHLLPPPNQSTVHSWNTFTISADGKRAYAVAWEANGIVADIDLDKMKLVQAYTGNGLFDYPHGSAVKGNKLYVTAQTGNFIYKMDTSDISNPNKISLDGTTPSLAPSLDPHEIVFSPDGSKYFVTCQKSNEVRVMQTSNDSLLDAIAVGGYCVEMSISNKFPYLFVTCMEDIKTYPGLRGSVYIIDYNTHTVIKSLYSGSQPHGIAVSDKYNRVYVANRNVDPSGPAPHHGSEYGGRNGYVTAIDMFTLDLIPGFKTEVSVDPYGIAVWH